GNDRGEFGKALGELGHGVEFVRLAFGAALLERFEAALIGAGQRNGQSLRKQIIAGVTGCDFDLVGLPAKTYNVVDENDFSFWHGNKQLRVESLGLRETGSREFQFKSKWNVVVFRRRRGVRIGG